MPNTQSDMTSVLEQTYARALLEMVDEQLLGAVDEITAELQQLLDLTQSEPELVQLISTRTMSAADRAGVITRVFKGRITDLIYHFLLTVNEKNRLDQLQGIIRAFVVMTQDRKGMIEADAYVATTLNDEGVQLIASGVGNVIGKQVLLRQHVDPALIGGLKLRIGDQLIDGSVAAQLKIMRQRMINTGRDKARTFTTG